MSEGRGPRPCRKCGMTIEFIEGPNGKAIPAQRIKVVYVRSAGKLAKVAVEGDVFVNHFETCPSASSFSRGRSS